MIPVNSSNLAAVDYDEVTQTLYIQFHSGGRYKYFNVPAYIYQGLLNADSKGKYHHAHIKYAYRFMRF